MVFEVFLVVVEKGTLCKICSICDRNAQTNAHLRTALQIFASNFALIHHVEIELQRDIVGFLLAEFRHPYLHCNYPHLKKYKHKV